MSGFGGVRIISEPRALKETRERLFPESRHRSARVKKKLINRFGGEFRMEPCLFRLADGTIIAHPALYRQVVAALQSTGAP